MGLGDGGGGAGAGGAGLTPRSRMVLKVRTDSAWRACGGMEPHAPESDGGGKEVDLELVFG